MIYKNKQWRYHPMMNLRNKKAKVTPETVAEAQALSELWNSRSHPSQAVFGETFEIGNQSAVGQFLRGDIPLSPKAAFGFAKGLSCSVADFSPRIAKIFPVSRVAVDDALQCIASHIKLLDSEDRATAAFLTNCMIQQTEKTDIYKSMLAQLLSPSISEEKNAQLLSRLSSAKAAKVEIPPRPSLAEAGKAALLSRESSAEAKKAELLSRLSSAEAAKAEPQLPPTAITEAAKKTS
jgi:hypothetical protein